MSPSNSPLLAVSGLHKAFGANQVLKGIDFTVHSGEVLALIGPSGSGKTTALRCLNGLEIADAGSVGFAGGPEVSFSPGMKPKSAQILRNRSAMVFQGHHLFPHLTVLQNVSIGPIEVQKRPKDQVLAEAKKLLARVGLEAKADAYPNSLSGGQQQRVGIVRALMQQPDLLLFDEPTSALDPELVGEVLTVIKELAQEGWSMVLVTHELAFARDVADTVVFMDGGVVVESGPAAQVLGAPANPRTRSFVQRLLHPF
ncbi:amino acid ABC transporter ATP-binding protein [Glutamicibacter nicotianae]|uniref:L-cystine import ATP-binding protein TcyC n=1 Tax=Glutamicibacter nicotianae TaxID=37929 RepID=A0ABQ0RNM7_GLUNI|nr:amino acid ABC transporter ATP-binding protein [Glutamicibacter nicotianae]GEC13394.1 L-cystine import ATP-binding protein TcyC [Glutamicibacter nicotianae]